MRTQTLPPSSHARTAYSIVVAALFMVLAAELWHSVQQLSQTADEGAHLYAGYRYLQARDFGVNPEHPPLLKLVAALPIINLKLAQPHPPPVGGKIEEYIGGAQLLYQNDADALLWRARIAASLFSFLLAALVFAAAYEMFGSAGALFALTLYVFEPTLLAHGALVTTDMVAACTIFAAVYALYRFQQQRTLGRLLLIGLAIGLAAAAKFSAIALLPILAACLMADWFANRFATRQHASVPKPTPENTNTRTGLLRWLGGSLAVFFLAWVVLWAVYGFTYHARPGAAQLTPTLPAYAAMLIHPWETKIILWLARWHLLPEAYLYGLVDFQVFGASMPSFLLGKVHPGPTKLYFPTAFLIKSTLPVLLLLASLPFLLLRRYTRLRRELIFLVVPIVLFLGVSLFAPQNIGVRHILPIFPFVVLLAALSASLLASHSRALGFAAYALVLLHALSSLHAFPNYIPYANEAFGGPSKTYRFLTDSNTDWGQGLKQVRAYLDKNHVDDCWYVPFGGPFMSHLDYYRIACKPLPSGFATRVGFPSAPIPPHVHGTVLVSTTEASGLFWGPPALNPYAELVARHPDALIANSILVFHGDFHLARASAQTHSSASSFLMRQGRLPEALAEAETAASLAGDSPDIQANLGAVLLKSGREPEAQQAFQRALDLSHTLDPDDLMKIEKTLSVLKQ